MYSTIYSFSNTFKYFEISIAVLAVIGNLIVIILFVKEEKLRTRTFCFVFALSVADFCIGSIVIPLELVVIL